MLAHALPGRDVVAPFDRVGWHPPNDGEPIECFAELSWDKKKQSIRNLPGLPRAVGYRIYRMPDIE